MQKQAPTLARLLTMAIFALSCFGLLLFLWLAFGGPVPLKPQGYQFRVAIPEANQLAVEADVRSSGVTIGKIKKKVPAPKGNKTLVTVQLQEKYAPLDADARVIQRSKTILGERFLEVTRGTPGGPQLKEDGRLPDASVEETVELDEVLNILDEPTRRLFRTWQRELGEGIGDRGKDLNDALGNLPRFVASGTDLLKVLNTHDGAVRGLVRNTGVMFGALTEREDQLQNVIRNSDRVFETTAQRQEALADTFRVFPTFLDEARETQVDLESFSRETRPLVQDLRPAMQDLRPTLRDVRRLAPDLRNLFRDLDPLIDEAQTGMPAVRDTLQDLRVLTKTFQPWLEEVNPPLEWFEYQQHTLTDFFANGGGALVDTQPDQRFPFEMGHYLGQFSIFGSESVQVQSGLQGTQPPNARGNAYPDPTMTTGSEQQKRMIIASWDCRHTGKPGEPGRPGWYMTKKRNQDDAPSCWTKRLPGPTQFPHITANDYSKPSAQTPKKAWNQTGK